MNLTGGILDLFKPWAAEDSAKALAESWLLSKRTDGYWQIQRYDDGHKDWSDFEAFAYCRALAETGSVLHAKAIRLHGTNLKG